MRASKESIPSSDSATPTILFVDDEPGIVSSLVDLFRGQYRVLTASSGDQALEVLASNDVAAVISDQRMPSMTGAELLERVADQSPDITRVLLTGYADIEAVIEAVNQGKIFFYLTKPWAPSDLNTVVAKAIDHHILLRERRELINQLRAANADLEAKIEARTHELAQKNEALEALDALKNEFLGMASHDLRGPIANVFGLADLMLAEDVTIDHAETVEYLGMIRSTCEGMLVLLTDLLDITRIESGKLELKPEAVDVAEFVAEVTEYFRLTAERKRIRLETEIAVDASAAFFDRERVRQVLTNLVGNAFKYSPADTVVHVVVEADRDVITVAVVDEGPGIRPEEQQRLFAPFSRASTVPTGGERSTGLGLSICKKIVEEHGGSICVESVFGCGSTFAFTLPRSAPSAGEAATPDAVPGAAPRL